MNPRDTATDLAARGIPVFPCRSNKSPATEHGFHDASADSDTVADWWKRTPGALVGVPTGAASGFDALDVDPRHGGEHWWIAHVHRMPETRMHRTGSGGLHVLFRHVERVRNTESKLAKGIDTRGAGGYIIWWPAHGCRVTDAPLAPWPAWLLRRLLARPKPPKRAHAPVTPMNPDDAAQRLATRMLHQVADAADGQRHYALRRAAYTIGGLLKRLPFGEGEARRRLVDAVKQAGAEDLDNAEKTAAWGLEKGAAMPLNMGPR